MHGLYTLEDQQSQLTEDGGLEEKQTLEPADSPDLLSEANIAHRFKTANLSAAAGIVDQGSHLAISYLQRTYGNIATMRAFGNGNGVRFSGFPVSKHNGLEKEASYAARQAAAGRVDVSLSAANYEVQSLPEGESPTGESITNNGNEAHRYIVDDIGDELQKGQMLKSAFMSQLKIEVCTTVDQALAATPWSAAGCPWITRWFGYYENRSAEQIERAIQRYAPAAAQAENAQSYIPVITARVRQGVQDWLRTGRVPEAPAAGIVPTPQPAVVNLVNRIAQPGSLAARGLAMVYSGLRNIFFKARPGGHRGSADPGDVISRLGSGQPLDSGVQHRMGAAFGRDFSKVRVHTDSHAGDLSRSFNARAFTVGNDIAFGPHEYRPGTVIGDALIAHELAHTVQQSGSGNSPASLQEGQTAPTGFERDADQAAAHALGYVYGPQMTGLVRRALPMLRGGLRLQRCGGEPAPVESYRIENPPESIQDAENRIVELIDQTTGNEAEAEILGILLAQDPDNYERLVRRLSERRTGKRTYLQRLYEDMHGEEFQAYLQINRAKLLAARAGNPENLEATIEALERGAGDVEEISYDPSRFTAPSTWGRRSILYEGSYNEEGEVTVLERRYSGTFDVSGRLRRVTMGPTDLAILDAPQSGGRRVITAAGLLAQADEHERDYFWSNVNIIGIMVGGFAIGGARSLLGKAAIAVFEVAIPAAVQYISDHQEEIAGLPGGRRFLRAWQIFNLGMAGFGIMRLAWGGGRSLATRLRQSGDELASGNPGNTVAQEAARLVRAVDDGFDELSIPARLDAVGADAAQTQRFVRIMEGTNLSPARVGQMSDETIGSLRQIDQALSEGRISDAIRHLDNTAGDLSEAERASLASSMAREHGIADDITQFRGTSGITSQRANFLRQIARGLRDRFSILGRLDLDGAAVARIIAKGPDINAMKGQLLEELMNVQVRRALGTSEGRATLGLSHVEGELVFIEGHRIADASGLQLTDGIIAVRRGNRLEIQAIIEAKAGRGAAQGLSRSHESIRRMSRANRVELFRVLEETIPDQIDNFIRRRHPDHVATLNAHRFNDLPDDVINAVITSRRLRYNQAGLVVSEVGGQIMRDVERLYPNVGQRTTTIRVDGRSVEVTMSPTQTRFLGALPENVSGTRIQETLRARGYNFAFENLGLSSQDLIALARELYRRAVQSATQ